MNNIWYCKMFYYIDIRNYGHSLSPSIKWFRVEALIINCFQSGNLIWHFTVQKNLVCHYSGQKYSITINFTEPTKYPIINYISGNNNVNGLCRGLCDFDFQN